MSLNKLQKIISEEVDRVLQQEVARYELSLLENKYRDVSNKFKDALDRLPDRAFTSKNIEKLIKKMREKRPDAAMAYAKDAFGWLMKEDKALTDYEKSLEKIITQLKGASNLHAGQADKIEKIVTQLRGASKLHGGQADKILDMLKKAKTESVNEALKVAPQKHREMEFGVEYRDSKGRPKKKGEPLVMRFKTKAQADKYANRGNKVDKVGGKYTVVRVPVQEKFDSKAQQRYMFATNPKAAKKLASKMTKKDYDELPDKVSKENVAPDHDGKAAPYGSGYKKVKDLEESTKAYEKALQKIARDNKLKMLSKSDKEKLIKIAQMLKKANESVTEGKLTEISVPAKFGDEVFKVPPIKMNRDHVLKVAKKYKVDPKLAIKYVNQVGRLKLKEATDINDPVLVAFRASRKNLPKFKPAKTKARRISFDKYLSLLDAQTDIGQDIKDKAREMAQTLRDMEQEAEPEGGKVADRYGSIMMKQEKEYAKLKAKKAKIDARVEKYKMM